MGVHSVLLVGTHGLATISFFQVGSRGQPPESSQLVTLESGDAETAKTLLAGYLAQAAEQISDS
jgi:hypothetical protein